MTEKQGRWYAMSPFCEAHFSLRVTPSGMDSITSLFEARIVPTRAVNSSFAKEVILITDTCIDPFIPLFVHPIYPVSLPSTPFNLTEAKMELKQLAWRIGVLFALLTVTEAIRDQRRFAGISNIQRLHEMLAIDTSDPREDIRTNILLNMEGF